MQAADVLSAQVTHGDPASTFRHRAHKTSAAPTAVRGELPLPRKGLGHNWDAEVGAKQSARGQQKSNIVFLLLKVSFFQVHYSIKV